MVLSPSANDHSVATSGCSFWTSLLHWIRRLWMRRIGSNCRADVARNVFRWSGQPQASWMVFFPVAAGAAAGLVAAAGAGVGAGPDVVAGAAEAGFVGASAGFGAPVGLAGAGVGAGGEPHEASARAAASPPAVRITSRRRMRLPMSSSLPGRHHIPASGIGIAVRSSERRP